MLFPILFVLATSLPVKVGPPTSDARRDTLLAALTSTLADKRLSTGFAGAIVAEEATGKVWFEQNADHVFMPASNQKLLTAFAISEAMIDKSYHTRVFATSERTAEGTLTGSLILIGDGDPALSPDQLKWLAQQVADTGIRRVMGGIHYSAVAFDNARLGDSWSWDDEPFYYSAQVSGLNCNENLVSVSVTAKDGKVSVTLNPPNDYVKVVNTVSLVPASQPIKTPVHITRRRAVNVFEITGEAHETDLAKRPATEQLTVEDPARYTATLFVQSLKAAGVKVDGTISETTAYYSPIVPEASRPVAEIASKPIPALLSEFLKPSDNLYGECFLKTVGRDPITHTGGSILRGVKATEPFFRDAGLDLSRLHIVDGSGLSQHNFVSPRNLEKLLLYVTKRPYFPTFYNALPVAGVDGSLRNRLKGKSTQSNIHAKTGSLSHASSLTGYVTTKGGTKLVFSLLMNNFLCTGTVTREIQDKFVTLLADYHGE